MLGYLIEGVYVLIGLALLVHCIRRRSFYPVFGTGRLTKIVWLLSFALLNPLVNLAYVVFGVLLRAPADGCKPRGLRWMRIVAITWVAVAIWLVNMPFSSAPTKPREETSNTTRADSARLDIRAHVGTITANNQSSVSSSMAHSPHDKLAVRTMAISCTDSHRMLTAIAADLQTRLAGLPGVETVTYYPPGTRPERGARLPDATLTLHLPQVRVVPLPIGRNVKAVVAWELSDHPYQGSSYISTQYSPPVVEFTVNGQIQHESTSHGVELGTAKYKQVAENIATEVAKSASKLFSDATEKQGLMPELPEAVYGEYVEPPTFPFIENRHAEEIISGPRLLTHNATVWRFPDSRPDSEAFKAYSEELAQDGWTGSEYEDSSPYVRLQRGAEMIYVFRELPRNPHTGAMMYDAPQQHAQMPMIARYHRYFSKDDIHEAMKSLLDGPAPLDTLLVFDDFFKTGKLRERFHARLEDAESASMDAYLYLAGHYHNEGDSERAVGAFMKARAMERAATAHSYKRKELRKLAKELGDETLMEQPIDGDILRSTGFLDVSRLPAETTAVRALDEPLALFQEKEDGELDCFSFRVQKTIPAKTDHYQILEVRKTGSSSNTSVRGPLGFGQLNSPFSAPYEVNVTVEPLDDGRFKFVIHVERVPAS